MNKIFQTIINILAVIALIIIGYKVIKYFYDRIKDKKNNIIKANINPPGDYMQNSGIKCPDYFVYLGNDSNGNYICKNSFNIQQNAGQSPDCNTQPSITFSPIQTGYTWDYNNPNGLTSYNDDQRYNFVKSNNTSATFSRCDWVNKCGPNSNTQGIWSGVNETCNTPPQS